MSELIKHQIIEHNGIPMFVVVPYKEYLDLLEKRDENIFLPNEVVKAHTIDEKSLIRAWREYKKLSQQEVADRMGITQPSYAQMESNPEKLRITTLQKIANALEIDAEQITD